MPRLRPVGVVRRQRGVEHAVEGVDVEGGGVGLAQDEEGGELGLLEQSLEQRGRALRMGGPEAQTTVSMSPSQRLWLSLGLRPEAET
eukprot:2731369-Prymnesium_polylepis.2